MLHAALLFFLHIHLERGRERHRETMAYLIYYVLSRPWRDAKRENRRETDRQRNIKRFRENSSIRYMSYKSCATKYMSRDIINH